MAKVLGGLESLLSGKFGNMVFVHRQGKTYVRSAPKRTKDSNSPAMLLNQQRFGAIIRFCGQFKDSLIPQIWNPATDTTSGYKLFLKTNSPAFSKDGSVIDAKKVQLSTGKLPLPMGLEAQRPADDAATITVSWQKDSHLGGLRLKDELMVISAADGSYSEITATGILRNALSGTFNLPQLPADAKHIYLFFASQDRREYSESVCF